MKYIIMCGGEYRHWEKPRQLFEVNGEVIVERTIRLLRENGITDIAVSSNNEMFSYLDVPILKHDNKFVVMWHNALEGDWFNAFYPTDEPTCYIFGDVYFSEEAIKTIINTETDDIEFFGSRPPFAENYIKTHEEPFALKVVNTQHLKEAINKTRELDKQNKFWRKPCMWELWTVIKEAPLQKKAGEYTAEYTVINDYTCDIDWKEDVKKLNKILGGTKMVRVEVIEKFTFERFAEIEKSIVRKSISTKGMLYVGDTFECDEEMAKYLTGGNSKKKVVVKVIEVLPKVEAKVEYHEEAKKPKAVVKTTKKSKK